MPKLFGTIPNSEVWGEVVAGQDKSDLSPRGFPLAYQRQVARNDCHPPIRWVVLVEAIAPVLALLGLPVLTFQKALELVVVINMLPWLRMSLRQNIRSARQFPISEIVECPALEPCHRDWK